MHAFEYNNKDATGLELGLGLGFVVHKLLIKIFLFGSVTNIFVWFCN